MIRACSSRVSLAVAAVLAWGCATGCESTAARDVDTRARRRAGPAAEVRARYSKREVLIPMRDGTRLFTAIYEPRDDSRSYPIMLLRTPYSVRPYGAEHYRDRLGPSRLMQQDEYIFVYQDVRGCYMSGGTFVNMRPHRPDKQATDVDESTDTWDTIEWLQSNVANHNGRVGMWGISYPGFYAAAGMIDAHPALIAVSPQAPVSDWFFDDFHHHGAFFLPHAFNFLASFGRPRPEPTTSRGWHRFDHGTPDGYAFFLELGPLKHANERHFKGDIAFWNDIVAHPNYDDFWQARNIVPHLENVAPAVMTVGGWYDAEDLWGPLKIYRSVERRNPEVFNILVMGPWRHGGWARDDGDRLGHARFGSRTSLFYRAHIERAFFNHFLKDGPDPELPEAFVFDTGARRWRRFASWPPAEARRASLYVRSDCGLAFAPPTAAAGTVDAFVSDPDRPVPYTEAITTRMTREYMTDDQRFASRRPDVLAYATPPLEEPLTVAGPLEADLWVETSRTAADWVVKLIDVLPPDAEDPPGLPPGVRMGGYEMMVRSEVIRGRFRNSYEHPEPFVPDQPTRVRFELQDVLHTFGKGHRIMIQIQSTWFPLVDRNPQNYVDNIFLADEDDFAPATHRVHRSAEYPSGIHFTTID